MQSVEVTARLDAPRTAVEDALSPRTIVEYEGTYKVQSVEERVDGWVVFADAPEIDAVLRFTGQADGYEYEQDEEGPFEHLRTTVTVSEATIDEGDEVEGAPTASDGGEETTGEITRVTFRSEFTFGGFAAPLLDRLAARSRRNELERAIVQLAEDLDEDGAADMDENSGDAPA